MGLATSTTPRVNTQMTRCPLSTAKKGKTLKELFFRQARHATIQSYPLYTRSAHLALTSMMSLRKILFNNIKKIILSFNQIHNAYSLALTSVLYSQGK